MDTDPNNYSVKEILTQFVWPSLKDMRDLQTIQNAAHDARLKRLENFKAAAKGAFALVTVILIPVTLIVVPAALGWK